MVKSKKGQLAIFVIIAIVLIAGIVGYVLLKDRVFVKSVPQDLKPAYDYYINCLEANVIDGASILGSQGGYIELPEFEAGSEYAPFSNQLEFFGAGIPYWYYVSGNNIISEQVPSEKQMQEGLADYLEEEIADCNFDDFIRQGYEIELGDANAKTEIKVNEIEVNMKQSLVLRKEDQSIVINNHNLKVNSQIGSFYDLARGIYDYEKQEMFLEDYAVDVLYNYAPVVGTEVSCSPLTWNPYEVVDELQSSLSANIQSLKVKGDYYELEGEGRDYFVVDPGFEVGDSQVNFLYSPSWASRFEVWPTKGNIMVANPVGPQEGIASSMGFCYISYKFVYDMYFPVLIQIQSQDGREIFQFPISVVVSKNQPRQSLPIQGTGDTGENICDNANTDISVYTYDVHLNPVEANVDFTCLTDVCQLGKTEVSESNDAVLEASVPQCVNGIINVNAEGYKDESYIISTNEETIADIVLDKEYDLKLEVFVDGAKSNDLSILTITENLEGGEGTVINVFSPDSPEFKLAEGDYKFDLKVFGSKRITIPERTEKYCSDVPREGVQGLLGITDEQCVELTVPSQTLNSALKAGGSVDWYLTDGELAGRQVLRIYAESVGTPTQIEEIAEIYNLIGEKNIQVEAL